MPNLAGMPPTAERMARYKNLLGGAVQIFNGNTMTWMRKSAGMEFTNPDTSHLFYRITCPCSRVSWNATLGQRSCASVRFTRVSAR